MKLDATALRYLTRDDFRVLAALEIGSRNHEAVPLALLASLARMRPGALHNRLAELAKHRLVARENHSRGEREEGYRLTYGGYDYLALHALAQRGTVTGVGRQIGVGKESDVYLVTGDYLPEEGADRAAVEREYDFVLKLQRLGRTSFRTVKTNRDYMGKRKSCSWMYLSRLAAEKEWAFLTALHARGLPTPRPVDHSRHCVAMAWVPGRPLDAVGPQAFAPDTDTRAVAEFLFGALMALVVRLAGLGLVHGDFNEFNTLVLDAFVAEPAAFIADDLCPVVMIDFPQMISVRHPNAREQFERDVNCLRAFFTRRFGFEPAEWPVWGRDVCTGDDGGVGIDHALRASGYRGTVDRDDAADAGASDSDADSDSDGSVADSGSGGSDAGDCTHSDNDSVLAACQRIALDAADR